MIDIKAGMIRDRGGRPLVTANTSLFECSTINLGDSVEVKSNSFIPDITYVYGLRDTMQTEEVSVALAFMKDRLQKITLTLVKGPASTLSWEKIDRTALKHEVDLITLLVTKEVGRSPSRKLPLCSEWSFAWGTAIASAETKSFSCALYMSFSGSEKEVD